VSTLINTSGICKFVGLDVHKERVSACVADAAGGDVRDLGSMRADVRSLEKILKKLGPPESLLVVYEAGPTGYGVCRWLREHGYRAEVIAPSLIPQAAGDRIKTDRRDAAKLARLARAGELHWVTVPDERDEAMRDLTRAREDVVEARLRVRQQINALLLRHGVIYPGKSRWTAAHATWLKTLRLKHAAQQWVLEEALQSLASLDAQLHRLETGIDQELATWRFAPVVKALEGLRGIARIAAVTLTAEIGDIRRFAHPRELMAFLGLVPSEHTSGNRIRRGRITRAGNAHARRMLVEAGWQYRFRAQEGKRMRQRLNELPVSLQRLSWRAQERLCGRYRRLSGRGLHQNKVCVAVARELAGFIWAMAREVEVARA
jgi:transposase